MTVTLPCKIGDMMWCIKNQAGIYTAQQGIVSEIFFRSDMELIIVVKYVGRGVYGDKIFSTQKACKEKADYLNAKDKEPRRFDEYI